MTTSYPLEPHRERIDGDCQHPLGMGRQLAELLRWLAVHNYAPGTVRKRREHGNHFIRWADERSLTRVSQVTRTVLERYQRHLAEHRGDRDKPLSFHAQQMHLSSLRAWFRWLTQQRVILHNPASELVLPRPSHPLPARVLTPAEVEAILNGIDTREPLGIRNRAMLETLYSSGIRRMELAQLAIDDLDLVRGVLQVRRGKGQKDRFVPLGRRAQAWIEKYRQDVRPQLLLQETDRTLFLTRYGRRFALSSLSSLLRACIVRIDPQVAGSCHLFRHAMATALHEAGADVRYVQAMLGHANLTTTQIYTQVSIHKLKEIHTRLHPARHPDDEPREP